MPAPRVRAGDRSRYVYRRRLDAADLRPAVGVGVAVGVGAGLAAFYLARLLLQRTPLGPAPEPAAREDHPDARADARAERRAVGADRDRA